MIQACGTGLQVLLTSQAAAAGRMRVGWVLVARQVM
jgi:hypothetical protein